MELVGWSLATKGRGNGPGSGALASAWAEPLAPASNLALAMAAANGPSLLAEAGLPGLASDSGDDPSPESEGRDGTELGLGFGCFFRV